MPQRPDPSRPVPFRPRSVPEASPLFARPLCTHNWACPIKICKCFIRKTSLWWNFGTFRRSVAPAAVFVCFGLAWPRLPCFGCFEHFSFYFFEVLLWGGGGVCWQFAGPSDKLAVVCRAWRTTGTRQSANNAPRCLIYMHKFSRAVWASLLAL